MRFFKRLKERSRQRRFVGNQAYTKDRNSDGTDLVRGNFSAPTRWMERIASRRKFRISVSSNRKWIFIGVAVVAVCGTIVYLSVTYGGGLMGLLR